MESIDFMVADEAAQYTGMSHAELSTALNAMGSRAHRLRSAPGLTFVKWVDVNALRNRPESAPGAPKPAANRKSRKSASAKAGAAPRKTRAAKAETSEPAPIAPMQQPVADPYPVDLEAEAEELATLPKPVLQAKAKELALPESAYTHFRRLAIAQAIVEEQARRWYAKAAADDVVAASNVTPLRKGGRKGRKGSGDAIEQNGALFSHA